MKWRAYMLAILCAGLVYGVAVLAQIRADAARTADPGNELLYLPNTHLLKHFTAGMDSVVADILWLQCIQYTGRQVKGDHDFKWLEQMINMVVRLDPHFVDAYRYGGMFLAALRADAGASLDLLKRGIVQNPEAYELPYEAAMVYLLNRGQDPDSRRYAAHYLGMSAATGKAPEFVLNLAAKLQGRYDLFDIERQMWTDLSKSDDRLLRELAERKLIELELRRACQILNERMAVYVKAQGRVPASLGELVAAGLLQAVPADPLGGAFFIDPNGTVQNTTILDEMRNQYRNLLRNALEFYHKKYSAWPPTLDTLVQSKAIEFILEHPYEGRDWVYDPETGSLD